MKATLSERFAAWLIRPLLVFAIWLDNHPINVPDLTPHIDRVMEFIDPALNLGFNMERPRRSMRRLVPCRLGTLKIIAESAK